MSLHEKTHFCSKSNFFSSFGNFFTQCKGCGCWTLPNFLAWSLPAKTYVALLSGACVWNDTLERFMRSEKFLSSNPFLVSCVLKYKQTPNCYFLFGLSFVLEEKQESNSFFFPMKFDVENNMK